MLKKVIPAFVLGFIVIGGAAAYIIKHTPKSSRDSSSGKIQVTSSIYPLAFFAQQIGGDKASVTNIIPAGVEPHDYEPTAQDMAKMESSQLIVLNGAGLEAWSANVQKNINARSTTVVFAGQEVATQQLTEDGQTGIDPHVWLAPPLAQKMVDTIAQGFEKVDPANANYYLANANALKTELNELDIAYKQGLSNCAQKNLITSHAAFGYLAATYGLQQVAIAGLSPDTEPSSAQLAVIVKFAKDNNVQYIFFENLVSPKLAQTIATEIGAKTLVLNPIEGLSSQELAQGKTYFTLMQENLTNLQIALQCTK